MIKATEQLMDYLQRETPPNWEVISAFTNVIEVKGGPEDGEVIGKYLLDHQGNFMLSDLYQVILACGTPKIAEGFLKAGVREGRLIEGIDLEVLEVIGRFQLEEARSMLVHYALDEYDYYTSLHAVRGLLNYNCDDLQETIQTAIRSVYNKSLFNELVPALVCKLKDRKDVLEQLYISGSNYCSSDCNGGIILGFSLCGSEGIPYFKKALFNPFWEAHYPSRHYVVEGMENLGLSLADLFKEIQGFQGRDEQSYGLQVLLSLLEVNIKSHRIKRNKTESYTKLMEEFFTPRGGNFSGDLTEFAKIFEKQEQASEMESLLRLRLREEVILSCL